jgi:hypothetical protein
MEKIITDTRFKAILSTSYFSSLGNMELFYEKLEKEITNSLPENRKLNDIELIERNENKWNIILTLDNDEEYLYKLNISDLENNI